MGTLNVLFLCTRNSARSLLAEATLNQLGHGAWRAYSAGSAPAGEVHPGTLAQLARSGISGHGLRSKSWDAFSLAGAELSFDAVITVCARAEAQVCPAFPGDFVRASWTMEDPAAARAGAETEAAFARTHRVLVHRIRLLIGLPLAEMPRDAAEAALHRIGSSVPG